MIEQVEKEMSLPWEIFTLLSQENPPCSLHELSTIYDMQDVYDMLEVIEVVSAIKDAAFKDSQVNK